MVGVFRVYGDAASGHKPDGSPKERLRRIMEARLAQTDPELGRDDEGAGP